MFAFLGNERVLVLRLGAMGDVLHALPAVEALARSYPRLRIHWLVKPQWLPLLDGNPFLSRLIPYRRDWTSLRALAADLRAQEYDVALDLQGLLQSAMLSLISRARYRVGYGRAAAREKLASLCYQTKVEPHSAHIVNRHLEVVAALGATADPEPCWLPPGNPEGELPLGPFVLAAPFAGWLSKQWPLEYYGAFAQLLRQRGLTLVLNVAERDRPRLVALAGVHVHCSSIDGLIDATRRATAVLGLDSGPLHLAAALGKPGVALFGPTDPARNGPYLVQGGPIRVLRSSDAVTTYKREDQFSPSMRQTTPRLAFEALLAALDASTRPPLSQEGVL
ncbi:MAG: glycosyltransferase family 9 protein [Bryobacterales bacterium]|nr:glycosyltransferase family 9 protein [Bryobacterales bacterium]